MLYQRRVQNGYTLVCFINDAYRMVDNGYTLVDRRVGGEEIVVLLAIGVPNLDKNIIAGPPKIDVRFAETNHSVSQDEVGSLPPNTPTHPHMPPPEKKQN